MHARPATAATAINCLRVIEGPFGLSGSRDVRHVKRQHYSRCGWKWNEALLRGPAHATLWSQDSGDIIRYVRGRGYRYDFWDLLMEILIPAFVLLAAPVLCASRLCLACWS